MAILPFPGKIITPYESFYSYLERQPIQKTAIWEVRTYFGFFLETTVGQGWLMGLKYANVRTKGGERAIHEPPHPLPLTQCL